MLERTGCRLCAGDAEFRFQATLRRKYPVRYFECKTCGSLQTEPPHWLAEAYADNSLSRLDTGAAQRNIQNLAASFAIAKLFGARNLLDLGGGDGLLCRLLRDYGINCFVKDKFATPSYAQGYTTENFPRPDMIVGFEVLEHFAEPSREIADIFARNPRVLLLSTATYTGQDGTWWYLVPESGQHVFFYSRKALQWIGRKFGFDVLTAGDFVLFAKGASPAKWRLARLALSRRGLRLLKAWIVTRPTPGAWEDHLAQVEILKEPHRS
jgi:hypothetical protein